MDTFVRKLVFVLKVPPPGMPPPAILRTAPPPRLPPTLVPPPGLVPPPTSLPGINTRIPPPIGILPPAINPQLASVPPPISRPPPTLPAVAAPTADPARRDSYRAESRSQSPPLTEPEIEEIMIRNRAVSSSAISRAVSDASSGREWFCFAFVDVTSTLSKNPEQLFYLSVHAISLPNAYWLLASWSWFFWKWVDGCSKFWFICFWLLETGEGFKMYHFDHQKFGNLRIPLFS